MEKQRVIVRFEGGPRDGDTADVRGFPRGMIAWTHPRLPEGTGYLADPKRPTVLLWTDPLPPGALVLPSAVPPNPN